MTQYNPVFVEGRWQISSPEGAFWEWADFFSEPQPHGNGELVAEVLAIILGIGYLQGVKDERGRLRNTDVV